MSEKKIFSPKLYPIDKNLSRMWFIRYHVEDYVNGGFCSKKYYGQLNRVGDLQKRLCLAREYMEMMNNGSLPPNYQGTKNIVTDSSPKVNTNVIFCCKKYVEIKELANVKVKTASLYRSRINVFENWLISNGKNHLAIGAIDKDIARDFLKYLKDDKQVTGKTFNDYKSLLGSIWKEYRDKINGFNPWQDIKGLRPKTVHFKKFPISLQIKIKQTLPGYDRQLWLFVQCIYYCGFRPNSELRLMRVGDLKVRAGLFYVREEIGKGYRSRKINVYYKLLEQFIALGWHLSDPDYYIFSNNGCPGPNPLPESYFDKIWSKYRIAFNIDSSYKLYGNKHTGGRALTLHTDAFTTKEHFGHSTIGQTEEYIEPEDSSNDIKFVQNSFPEYGTSI